MSEEYIPPLKKKDEYNPDDMNIVVLTEEHLQRVVREAVEDGVEEYFKKVGVERLLRDMGIGDAKYTEKVKELMDKATTEAEDISKFL